MSVENTVVIVTGEQYTSLQYWRRNQKYLSVEKMLKMHEETGSQWDGKLKGLNGMPVNDLENALRYGFKKEE